MTKASLIIGSIVLALLAAGSAPAQSARPAKPTRQAQQAQPGKNGEKSEQQLLKDPFYPELPNKTVKIRYRLRGRFEGQEILAAKSVDRGVLKVREIKCVDTALGLERRVHLWFLELPEKIIRINLVDGGLTISPNLRTYLSRAWKKLTLEQKTNLAKNLPLVGPIVGKALKLSVAVAGEASYLGLAGIKVALGSGRIWYWGGTDLPMKSLGHQGGFSWDQEAIDIITDQDLGDDLFRLPVSEEEASRLEVSAADRQWAQEISRRVVELLSRQLQGNEDQVRVVSHKKVTYNLPVPWPFPPPPGFTTPNDQYRLDPNWVPYPQPPDRRDWPPPGLRQSILNVETEEIAKLLADRMPKLTPPDQTQAPQAPAKETSQAKDDSSGEKKGPPDKSGGPPEGSEGPPPGSPGPPKNAE